MLAQLCGTLRRLVGDLEAIEVECQEGYDLIRRAGKVRPRLAAVLVPLVRLSWQDGQVLHLPGARLVQHQEVREFNAAKRRAEMKTGGDHRTMAGVVRDLAKRAGALVAKKKIPRNLTELLARKRTRSISAGSIGGSSRISTASKVSPMRCTPDYDAAPAGSTQRAMLARSFIELFKESRPVGDEDPADRHSPEELRTVAEEC